MLSAHITSTLLACTVAVHALPQNYQYQYEPQNNEFNYEYKGEGEVAEVIGTNPYVNDPENYGKPWSYEYKYDPSQNQYAYAYDPAKDNYTFNFDGSGANPGNVVESVAASLTSLQKVVDNPAIVRALGLLDADCTIVADTKEALEDTQTTLQDNKPLLVKTLNDIQGLRSRSQQSAGDVIRTLSTALGDVEGLLPTFTKLFTFNNDCNFVQDAVISSRRRRQAVEGECADPKAFSQDIFSGVADLIDFAVELNNETPSAAVRNNELKEQAELIRDGAVSILQLYKFFFLKI